MNSTDSQKSTIQIPPLSGQAAESWSLHKLWSLLKSFGPAAILASMAIGAGETIVVVRAGAWARYDLLWVVLLSCLVKAVFVTYMLGRYTAISGEHIGHRLVRLPGPRGWFLLMVVAVELLFAPLAWVAIAKPCGNLLHYLIDYNFFESTLTADVAAVYCENVYTTLFVAAALIVSLTLTYERLEKEQLIICAILVTGTIIGTVMVKPDLVAAIKGTFLNFGRMPASLPESAPRDASEFPLLNLATVFAYVGGSVMGYIAYANWVGLRGWGLAGHPDIAEIRERAARSSRIDYLPDDPQQRHRLRKLAAPLRWDVALGGAVLFVVTAAFMVAGAAALYGKEGSFEGWRLLTDQAHIWRAIHPWLVPVYYVTVIAALWGTLSALPEVYSRVTQEFFSAIWPDRKWSYTIIRRVVVCTIFVQASYFIWANLKFDLIIQVAGFFLATASVAATALAGFYLNHKLPPAYRTHRAVWLAAALATLILLVVTCMSAYGLVRKLTQTPATAAQAAACLESVASLPPRFT